MAEVKLPRHGLRVVFLGMPGAGKSALIGALAQAAQTQENVLGGKLLDTTGQMTQLQEKLYANEPLDNSPEVAAYSFSLDQGSSPIQATLIDSAGKLAQDYLTDQPTKAAGARELAAALREADALIVVADPSAGGAQLEKDFHTFCNFVRRLESKRSRGTEVVGLPIFLVLTKCDLLAKPTDSGQQWMQRIEEGKRKIDKRVQEILDKEKKRKALPFGKADVRLWATAVKRPALADRPARPLEPYGVAELFRQCLDAARAYRDRYHQAQNRLQAAVVGFLGAIILLALAAAALLLNRPNADVAALESRIQAVLPGETSTAAEKLREPLQERLEELQKIQEDPVFADVSSGLRKQVVDLAQDIEGYQKYYKEFLTKVPDLRIAKDEADLAKIEKSVKAFTLPGNLAEDWHDTKLMVRKENMGEEIKKVREAVVAEEAWFKTQKEAARKLRASGGQFLANVGNPQDKEQWLAQVKELLKQRTHFKETERVAGTSIPYSTIYRFGRVAAARQDWEKQRRSLEDLRDDVK